MRAMSCAGAGILLASMAVVVAAFVWPATRWIGSAAELAVPHQLIWPMLANAIVIMSAYLAAVSLVWGFADASMDQPLDLEAFDSAPSDGRSLAGGAPLRHPYRRRALRISHRERAGRAAWQRARATGYGAPRGRTRRPAARPDLDHRGYDRRRQIVRVGRIPRHSCRPPGACRPDAHLAWEPRRQCRRSRQPGPARSAVQPGENVAQNAGVVGDGGFRRRSFAHDERRR